MARSSCKRFQWSIAGAVAVLAFLAWAVPGGLFLSECDQDNHARTAGNGQVAATESTSGKQIPGSFIVLGDDMATVSDLVRQAGGTVTHELEIINGVGASLTDDQMCRLERTEGITRIYLKPMPCLDSPRLCMTGIGKVARRS